MPQVLHACIQPWELVLGHAAIRVVFSGGGQAQWRARGAEIGHFKVRPETPAGRSPRIFGVIRLRCRAVGNRFSQDLGLPARFSLYSLSVRWDPGSSFPLFVYLYVRIAEFQHHPFA